MSRRLKDLQRHRENLREKRQITKAIVDSELWPIDEAIRETEKEIRKVKRKKNGRNSK